MDIRMQLKSLYDSDTNQDKIYTINTTIKNIAYGFAIIIYLVLKISYLMAFYGIRKDELVSQKTTFIFKRKYVPIYRYIFSFTGGARRIGASFSLLFS